MRRFLWLLAAAAVVAVVVFHSSVSSVATTAGKGAVGIVHGVQDFAQYVSQNL